MRNHSLTSIFLIGGVDLSQITLVTNPKSLEPNANMHLCFQICLFHEGSKYIMIFQICFLCGFSDSKMIFFQTTMIH
jgi:hypothetical protein